MMPDRKILFSYQNVIFYNYVSNIRYFSPHELLTLYTAQLRPSLLLLRISRTGRYDRSFVPSVSRLRDDLHQEAFPRSANIQWKKISF
ncbi:unnamed protein product [Acanthoscelides obtectus]|uniref:Uncharacterized protein n=1 Tax=Acanthoscelides obtectus TaxID=200917 RepID=A0A9P0PMS2_ACAOB|nr:unnamed protein product [Acanthoscelides obtectus]CAK1629644.1 hypothetical protein AOBTE_LOCUS5867 [Acanthoscelides obtectus]